MGTYQRILNSTQKGSETNQSNVPQVSSSKRKHIVRHRRNEITRLVTFLLISTACIWICFLVHFQGQVTKEMDTKNLNKSDEKDLFKGTKSSIPRRKVQDTTEFLSMYGKHRFDSSFHELPLWLQEYFNWHRQQTSLDSEKSKDTKYAVLVCLPNDTLCGGISDRLRPLLFYLFISKLSNRVLCIYWEKPFLLENYLQPIPDVGIDWRCPAEVHDLYDLKLQFNEQPNIKPVQFAHCQSNKIPIAPCVEQDFELKLKDNSDKYITLDLSSHSNTCVNNANILAQRYSYGGGKSNDQSENKNYTMPDIKHWEYPELIAPIFRVMFEPVPALARQINKTMSTLGLVENEYITAHVRARYPAGYIMKYLNATRDATFDKDGGLKFEGKLKNWMDGIIRNAIKCGHLLAPNLKVFFVSDHNYANNYAMTTDVVGANGKKVRAIAIDRKEEPLHMDSNQNQNSTIFDFYSVFEDLLIMGGSRCVSHGIGSFGSFGAGLSGNRCRAVHRKYTASSVTCPNDRGERKAQLFSAAEMMFGDHPGGEDKIEFKQ